MTHRTHRPSRTLIAALSMAAFLIPTPECTAWNETLPPDEQAIAGVRDGRIETARASWWGFDPADATQSLQAALNSKAKKVLVEKMSGPWIVTAIELPSNKEIVFERDVVVEAKRGAFLGKGDCLFVAKGCKRLAIRGEGATFLMHKADYHRPPYQPAEWRHALSIRECDDVTVEGLTLKESGGDGIYLGAGSGDAANRAVTIRNVVCDGNNRQGISVITAQNLLIEDCVFRDTRGTAPEAGIDFEPNRPEERLVNCVLRNCRSENNAGQAYHLYLGSMNESSTPVSIRFENCTSKTCGRYSTYVAVANREGLRTVRGSIEYVDCRFEADAARGVYIRGNEADGCRVRFERCQIIRRDGPDAKLAPITIQAPRRPDLDAGNIDFVDCTIRDTIPRRPLALAASPLTRLRNISGSLTHETPQGSTKFTLDDAQLAAWFPEQGLVDDIPRVVFDWRKAKPLALQASKVDGGASFRLRRQAALIVWGEAAQGVELAVKFEPVGNHTPSPGTMTLTTPGGESKPLKPTEGDGQMLYTFTPQATGPHRLQWQGDSRTTLRPVRCSAPAAILSESLGAELFRPTGRLYVPVPSGIARFAIQVVGSGTAETVKATVHDASDQVAAEQDNIALPHLFVLQRQEFDRNEIWSITLEKASEGVLEDVSIQTLGVPPVFGAIPGPEEGARTVFFAD
jgi:hypothetical protein